MTFVFPFGIKATCQASMVLAVLAIGTGDLRADAASHWAFTPVAKPDIPEEMGHPLDVLVREKLGEHGINPSASAEKRVLARRASFDLTGLPPEAATLDSFMNDGRPDAWGRYLDALLASPAYGERWGRHWLDVVRYADTQGYLAGNKSTLYPYAYTYRDWVIAAFNRDLPYDQFLKLQLAADHYVKAGEAGQRDLAALGMITVGPRFLGKTPEIIDDRIDVVGRGLLGLTVACARCHDHKFDPIPTSDYYALYGVFGSSEEPEELPLIGGDGDPKQRGEFEAALAAAEGKITAFRQKLFDSVRTPEALGDYLAMVIRKRALTPEQAQVEIVKGKLREKLVEVWERSLAKVATGADPHPVFRIWSKFEKAGEEGFAKVLEELKAGKVEGAIDRAIAETVIRRDAKTMVDVARSYGEIIGKVASGSGDGLPEEIRHLVAGNLLPTGADVGAVDAIFNRTDREEVAKLKSAVKKLEADHPGAPPRAMVVTDVANPRDFRVFVRGNPNEHGEVAPRRFLTVLGGKQFSEGSGRHELAEAIVDPANPLTARVMVNRIWLHHFGTPLVDTPSDFGVQCPEPEHRKLLDFLAARFVESGWSVKAMHRHIMTSETYRQSGEPIPEYMAADPGNRLFWRMPPRALDFEAMRDSMLAVSGELRRDIGGRPFEIGDSGGGGMRRTVYAKIDRQALPPVFSNFDFANPEAHAPSRIETMVPQKALFMLNGDFAAARSKAVARLPGMAESRDVEEKTQFLYRRLFGRDPDAAEIAMAREFIQGDLLPPAIPPGQDAGADWQYGFARIENGISSEFKLLSKFDAGRWQAGSEFPDKELGYVSWTRGGGHPGQGNLAAVMRWTAPRNLTVEVKGEVERRSDRGNGVRASIRKTGGGELFGTEVTPAGKASAHVGGAVLKKGESLDFVVEAIEDPSFDGFAWVAVITENGNVVADSGRDFREGAAAPPKSALDRWTQLAQVLLISNEFVFVD